MKKGGLWNKAFASASGDAGQGAVFWLLVAGLSLLALCLFMVWMNTERTMLAYKAHQLQRDVDKREELNNKLHVERDLLLSPQQLGQRAAAMGLHNAKPGQIRRMDSPSATGTADKQ